METILPQSTSFKWLILGFLAIMCILTYTLIVMYSTQYFSQGEKQKDTVKVLASTKTAISGSIDLNGTPPERATISLSFKQYGQPKAVIVEDIAAHDGAVWTWNDAKPGAEYILEGSLVQNGKTLSKSKTIVLIAPADSEIIRINVPALPQPTATKPVLAAVSGTFNINGYIPSGSTISLAVRKVGDTDFATITSSLPAVDNSSWSWIEGVQNTQYEIQALLSANGTTLAKSQVISVTAPATNETLTLQSTATLPASQPAAISGTINLNGYTPQTGSYITIGIRPTGNGQFTPIGSNLSATDGISWNYTNAQSGTSYDIQAYLWQNNTPFASSQILTVPAPATGEVLTINAMTPPTNAPTANSISINCNSSSANLWQITVNYNNTSAIQNAQQYWLTIGTNPGGNQQVSLITNPKNPNQTQTFLTGYSFNGTLTYYAQYAYATCANCNSFSPFSPSLTFSCTLPPTGTPIPSNTPVPTASNTPIPTPTSTIIPTPTTSSTPIPTPTTSPAPLN